DRRERIGRATISCVKQLVLACAVVGASPALAQPGGAVVVEEPPRQTPFDQGKLNLGFGFGAQTTLGARYYVVSGGAGYFVLDGVELGFGLAHQWGDGPSITRTTPSLR